MHEHIECKHKELTHCTKCDVVYCKECKAEWKKDYSFTYVNCSTTGTTRGSYG